MVPQQHGQKKIVQELFQIFLNAATNDNYKIFPLNVAEQLVELKQSWKGSKQKEHEEVVRIVVDLIAGMTEKQIVKIYHRLTGTSFGSVLDTIIV